MTYGVAGIVLAAGEGRRFGSPKALVDFVGRPLAERALRTLVSAGCSPVIVVLGDAAVEVQGSCALDEALIVVNDSWKEGLGSSLRAGLAAADTSGASATVVLPVDQPLVSIELVRHLIRAWQEGSPAAAAAFEGEGRTPVLLDRSLWPEVCAAAVGDAGGRAFLRSRPDLVELVDCEDAESLADIDTRSDLTRLENAYRRRQEGATAPPPTH